MLRAEPLASLCRPASLDAMAPDVPLRPTARKGSLRRTTPWATSSAERAQERLLARPALLDKLAATHAQRIVRLCAPAGYGKTRLMQAYATSLHNSGVATGWLTFSEIDNDLRYLALKLQDVMDAALQESAGYNDAADDREPTAHCTVFLDQVDRLDSDALDELVECLERARYLPVRFLLGSRSRHLLRLLSRDGRIKPPDIGTSDLAFTAAESRSVVALLLGGSLDDALVAALHAQAEGWPAALRLLCAGWQNVVPSPSSLSAGAQSERLRSAENPALVDFLIRNVVEKVPARARGLLLDLAAVNPVSAPLAERILERSDCQTRIEEVIEAGMPLQCLHSGWYRMHPLVARQLQRVAHQTDPVRYIAIGQRAGDWLAANGRAAAAVDTLLAAGRVDAAVRQIEAQTAFLVARADHESLLRWCEQLPDSRIGASANLCAAYAVCLGMTDQQARAAHWLARCNELSRQPQADPRLASAARLLQLQDLLARGTPAQVVQALPVLEAAVLDAGHADRRSLSALLAGALISTGDYVRAEKNILIAKRISREERCLTGLAHAHYLEAVAASARGRLRQAMGCLKTASLLAQEGQGHGLHAIDCGLMAALYYEFNQFEEVKNALSRQAGPDGFSPPSVDSMLHGALVGFRVDLAQQRMVSGLDCLDARLRRARDAGFQWVVESLELERTRYQALCQPEGADADWPLPGLRAHAIASRAFCLRPSEEVFGAGIAQARLLLLGGQAQAGLALVEALLAEAVAHERRWREAKLRILRVVALDLTGDEAQADQECCAALALGAEMGLVRSFLDEGKRVVDRVRAQTTGAHRAKLGVACLAYAASLLTAADAESQAITQPTSVSFSEQETRVLDLVAVGHPNKHVATALSLSVNTVKWHLARIYAKLGANSRSQAVFLARKRGFIA